ncbi:MAG: IPT/TIG domain-containing protein [Blastocatellia bacterium]|nr:IPT/TIG domain-containing protein [Blastocatellia bacterium]
MSDTIRFSKSRFLVFLVVISFLLGGLPFPFSGNARIAPRAGSEGFSNISPLRPVAASSTLAVQSSQPTYDMVIQDDGSGDMIRFNSTTGEYKYSRCGNGYVLTGTGTITKQGSTTTLKHWPSDRRVNGTANASTRRGSGSVQVFALGTTYSLTDRDITNNPGSTDLEAPQLAITAPNGGEIVDRGSSFTISWNSTDDVEIASHDILLSTNGGTSFSPVAMGLAGDVNQYAWTAPVGVNNQQVKVRVVARDAACNASADDSDANFTLWNPPASFTHVAEAPVYIVQGGFASHIHLCNTSPNNIVVELALHKPSGEATADEPAQILLLAGEARKLDVLDYLNPAPPADPFDTNIIKGSVRLRHNGANDGDVQAMVAVTRYGDQQSFAAPFIYLTSAQGTESTDQCAPMFYVDDQTDAMLALQNCKNYPVDVQVKLVYGTGEVDTPNGIYPLPPISLAGQERILMSLGQFKDNFQGAKWGSIILTSPPQSVAAHTVMMSDENGLAFSSSFVDPSLSTNTTKVASTLKLDYDTGLTPCVMICNTSDTETREVTAVFETDNGVVIPSRQVTLGPKEQRLIELDPHELLSPGQSAMADVRLNYTGEGKDIMAGAVSMSAEEGCAITARFVEPDAGDGQQLMSPFFKMDARTEGIVQISNLGTSHVRAGVSMKFANSTESALTTDLMTVAAGRTVTLNIQEYFDHVPDGVAAEGCLSVMHNGPPGTVTASFMALSGDAIETSLEGGPPFEADGFTVFPSVIIVESGDSTPISAVGDNTGGVFWDPSYGTITPGGGGDPGVTSVIYAMPDDDENEPDEATIQVISDDGSSIILVQIQKVKLKNIETFTAAGVSTNGRLNPDPATGTGATKFVLTAKKKEFPNVPLQVKFRQIINNQPQEVTVEIGVDSASRPEPKKLVGNAPANTRFIGDAQIVVFADNGNTKVSKKNLCKFCDPETDPDCPSNQVLCGAYYSFDPPSPPTSISAPGFNRLGGNLTITAAGGGFRRFESTETGVPPVNQSISIGRIGFAVNTVTMGAPSTINGNVRRADASIRSCVIEGEVPCKRIFVTNPGGRRQDEVRSMVPLYNLLPGPPPIPQSRFPDNGFSIGGTVITISGENLDFTDNVTIGGTDAPIITKTRTLITVATLPHVAGAANIILFDIDNAAPGGTQVPGGAFLYMLTKPTELPIPNLKIFIVGPGEGIDLLAGSFTVDSNINCITAVTLEITSVVSPINAQLGVQAARVKGSYNCKTCTCSPLADPLGCTSTRDGKISFTLFNTAAPMNATVRTLVERSVTVTFNTPSNQQCTGSF